MITKTRFVKGDYVITGVKNEFNEKWSFWISKKGWAKAFYCFSATTNREVDEQISNGGFDGYVRMFDLSVNPPMTGEKTADEIIQFVNSFGYDSKAFAKKIAGSHRTLQQSVVRLMAETIRELAKNSTDLRNEAAVQLCQKWAEVAENHSLPLI